MRGASDGHVKAHVQAHDAGLRPCNAAHLQPGVGKSMLRSSTSLGSIGTFALNTPKKYSDTLLRSPTPSEMSLGEAVRTKTPWQHPGSLLLVPVQLSAATADSWRFGSPPRVSSSLTPRRMPLPRFTGHTPLHSADCTPSASSRPMSAARRPISATKMLSVGTSSGHGAGRVGSESSANLSTSMSSLNISSVSMSSLPATSSLQDLRESMRKVCAKSSRRSISKWRLTETSDTETVAEDSSGDPSAVLLPTIPPTPAGEDSLNETGLLSSTRRNSVMSRSRSIKRSRQLGESCRLDASGEILEGDVVAQKEEATILARSLRIQYAPSLGQALDRHLQEFIGAEDTSLMKMTFRRFIQEGSSELDCACLGDVLVHLGYIAITTMDLREVLENSKYSTVSFVEFCDLMENVARYERTNVRRKITAWMEENPSAGVSEANSLLHALGVVVTDDILDQLLEIAGLEHSTLALTEREALRLVAALRVQEGLVDEEVEAAKAVFDRLDHMPRSELVKMSELRSGLLRFLGFYSDEHIRDMMSKLPAHENKETGIVGVTDGFSFYEFLILIRRVRALEMQSLWEAFLEVDAGGSGFIQVDDLNDMAVTLSFSLLTDEFDELLQLNYIGQDDVVDFSTAVKFMRSCWETNGFTPHHVQELMTVFERFDYSGTSELPRNQVLDMLRYLGHTATLGQVNAFIQRADFNSSGTIDRREYVRLIRFQRERDVARAQKAYDEGRESQDELPIKALKQALSTLGHRPSEEVLHNLVEAEPECSSGKIGFEAFVRTAERCRAMVTDETRLRSGMADEGFQRLKTIFALSDPEDRGFVTLGELMWMLSNSHLEVNTADGRREILEALDKARESAVEAGVSREDAGEQGSPQVKFWALVHLAQSIVREHEQKVVADERAITASTKFSTAEVARFREVFGNIVSESAELERLEKEKQAKIPTSPKQPAPKPVPTLGGLVKQLTRSRVLSEKDLVLKLGSMGLQLSEKHRNALQDKVFDLTSTPDGITFADFLVVMRWMLDSNFANINNATEKAVERLKNKGAALDTTQQLSPANGAKANSRLDIPSIRVRRPRNSR